MQSVRTTHVLLMAALAASAASCGGYHSTMERTYAGTISLRVVNRYATPLCSLFLVEGGSSSWGDSWISGKDSIFEHGRIAGGASKEFKVRAGSYQVSYAGCPADATATGGDGTVVAVAETRPAFQGKLAPFAIDQPIELQLHPPGTPATAVLAGYRLIDAQGSTSRGAADAWKDASGDCLLACTHVSPAEHEACMTRCERSRRQ